MSSSSSPIFNLEQMDLSPDAFSSDDHDTDSVVSDGCNSSNMSVVDSLVSKSSSANLKVSHEVLTRVEKEASEKRLNCVNEIVDLMSAFIKKSNEKELKLCLLTLDTPAAENVLCATRGEYLKQKDLNGQKSAEAILGYSKYRSTLSFLEECVGSLSQAVPRFKTNPSLTAENNASAQLLLSLLREEEAHLKKGLNTGCRIGGEISRFVYNWKNLTSLHVNFDNAWKYLASLTGRQERTLRRYLRCYEFLDVYQKFCSVTNLTLSSIDSRTKSIEALFNDKEWYESLSADEKKDYLKASFWREKC